MRLIASFFVCFIVPFAIASEGTKTKAIASEEAKTKGLKAVEGKSIGGSYGYGQPSYSNSYGGYNQGSYSQHHQYGNHHRHRIVDHHPEQSPKHVPIKVPYIDRNGCRFAGDTVCNDADAAAITAQATFEYCFLSSENKNLWKTPSFRTIVVPCSDHVVAASFVLADLCNNNVKLLRAAGLMKVKDEDQMKRFHQEQYSVMLNPCILGTDPAG